MTAYCTPADILARGLDLEPLDDPPIEVPPGTTCAISGKPITIGYPVADMVTNATNEFLDCFRGGVDGYVSDATARCFKAANPRTGNRTSRAVIVFEDGTYYNPYIARSSADKHETRECWSDRVRWIWPARAGQRVLIVLTTDYKRRLWIAARTGTLGSCTPVLVYDSDTAVNDVLLIDWPVMLECLNLVEEIYTAGFVKNVIRENLLGQFNLLQEVGFEQTNAWERTLRTWRGTPEFCMAMLIAQKQEES